MHDARAIGAEHPSIGSAPAVCVLSGHMHASSGRPARVLCNQAVLFVYAIYENGAQKL